MAAKGLSKLSQKKVKKRAREKVRKRGGHGLTNKVIDLLPFELHLPGYQFNSLQYTSLVCNLPFVGGPQLIHNAQTEYLTKIAPQVKDLFKVCTWRAAQVDCEEVFTPIINHHGNCFTFNSLAAEQLFTSQAVQKLSSSGKLSRNWDPEGGYEVSDDRKETYPRRSSAGLLAGLYISLRSEIESEGDPNCRVPMEGFKVMLHNPAVFPQVRQPFFQIPSKRQVMVWVKPEMMETDDHLRSYSPADRRCYFQKERILRYFNVYTQESCELECISNYTMKKCGCVMFYMPRSSDMPVCGSTKTQCVVKGLIQHHTEHDGHCQCLPSCTEIKYGMQMSQAKYKWEQADRLYKIPGSLAVAFQDTEIISSKRGELYGAADFVANCGGLLGLFLGFSILSLVEIIYFLTLRPCSNLIESSASKKI
ncbi:pickpocket protein 28 [Anabrus simplex]|uniref:pickpocket protein 28 n=1 Tax=Anabrus simplex TaxID=316456 RepID=UPI0035A3307C